MLNVFAVISGVLAFWTLLKLYKIEKDSKK